MANRWQRRKWAEDMPQLLAPWYDIAARLKRALFNRYYPLSAGEETAPFFLVGSGRCGSTLLRRVLQASPELHIPPESYVLGQVIELFKRNRQMDWRFLVSLVLGKFECHPHFDQFDISLHELAAGLATMPEAERSLAAVIDRLYRFHAARNGKEVHIWGDKTPAYVYSLDALHQLFPRGRFVHLLRDGVDVVHSYLKSGLISDLDVAAARWSTSIEAFASFASRHPDACLTVRYEEMVENPEAVVAQLCAFIGATFDPAMLVSRDHVASMPDLLNYGHYRKAAEPISKASIGLGREHLDEGQLERLQLLIGEQLVRQGYAPARSAA